MPVLRLNSLRGLSTWRSPYDLPMDIAVAANDIELRPNTLGRARRTLTGVGLTSGPTSTIYRLLRFRNASGTSSLFAFSGTSTLHRLSGGSWAAVTPSDTVANWATDVPHGAALNNKLFLCYNSNVNRLHVWDGSVVRRVGIEASAAPTVADTGAGAYAATLRYYKVQWKIISGSDTVATSELSAAQSFTPSGAGTAARVTKPTTPDSATHWVVFGSSDGITYYDLSGDIVVATTTYDDSATPSAYSVGAVAPSAGLYVPPPSAKFIVSDGNRLIMAGCHETTATATQTATRNSRVWWTQVLGALDNTGEDEAIAQTVSAKDWLDLGENDGDEITGLAPPINGIIHVFKARSVWRLIPTGIGDTPYRAELLSSTIGAIRQQSITVGEDGQGNPCVYFVQAQTFSSDRNTAEVLWAVLSSGRLVRAAEDLRSPTASGAVFWGASVLMWDFTMRMLFLMRRGGSDTPNNTYVLQPEFIEDRGSHWLNGWTSATLKTNASLSRNYDLIMDDTATGAFVPTLCGDDVTNAALATLSARNSAGDFGSGGRIFGATFALMTLGELGTRAIDIAGPIATFGPAEVFTVTPTGTYCTISLDPPEPTFSLGPIEPFIVSAQSETLSPTGDGPFTMRAQSLQRSDLSVVRVGWSVGYADTMFALVIPYTVRQTL